jgi:chemosensory pili system protein ChpA (sensor histidine kinase/response regulator)
VAPSVRKATVLVVEDDAALRTAYRNALTFEGYAVIAVEDGVDALRHIELATPNAVVLDLGLPRLHGRDVTLELKADAKTRHIPIVVVTGSDLEGVEPSDFDCVLRKPIDGDRLIRAVKECLRKHGA